MRDPVAKKWQGGVPLSLFARIDIMKKGMALAKRQVLSGGYYGARDNAKLRQNLEANQKLLSGT